MTKPSLSGVTIAFDLDGTLVDTLGDLHAALNLVLEREGLPPASLEEVRRLVGQGARTLIIRALGAHGVHPGEIEIDRLTAAYIAAYAENIAVHSRPFPGLSDALETLKDMGATLCVCTNKRTDLSVQLLGAIGLLQHFAAVAGADAAPNRKPHPDHYLAAIRMAHGDPVRSIMVGDSINDVAAAHAAGAPAVVYAFGYADTAPDLLGADAVFTHFTELPDLVVRLIGAQPIPRA